MLASHSALQCLTSHLIENARELCISKEFLLCKSLLMLSSYYKIFDFSSLICYIPI